MTVNPVVVAASDGPQDAWSGVWIAEDIELIHQGVRNGSWIDGTLGVAGAGLDALALISDPAGALLQYGVSWLIEHVKPLSEALDWLAGDPGQIAAHAQTWRNVGNSLRDRMEVLARAVRFDTSEWSGTAGDAYRSWAAGHGQALAALATASDTMSAIVEGAGMLIAAVRVMVRDAIATVVSRLIVYAAEEVGSFGLSTPLVVGQVTTLVASWAAKISQWLRKLIKSLRSLDGESGVLATLIEKISPFHRAEEPKPASKPQPADEPQPPKKPGPPEKIGGPKEFDPQELRGQSADDVRARIPDAWAKDNSARGGGEVYRDPGHHGRQIRIMPGYPPGSRADPVTWGPYAVVSQGGRKPVKIPLEGNPTL
ncbi:MAG TPA: WXG100 family type VII secretion target [Actinoplanes sp.]|jgi:hypothetical protein|nr:WXG100 family type VII secretion target [Actinoplanes sp.]